MIGFSVYIFILAGMFFSSASNTLPDSAPLKDSGRIEIRGIYGSPNHFWDRNLSLKELNVNAIFLNWHSIDNKLMERAKQEGVKVFAEFPVLNGSGYVDKHPEAWAIDRYGKRVEPASWFMGVCPTEPGFRQYRMSELSGLLRKFDLSGIFMDYMHWHAQFEEPEPILPETCFCPNCIKTFESYAGLDVPDGGTEVQADWILSKHDIIWREWRCSVIADWVRDTRTIIKKENPEALLGIYHCPWNDDEFNGARYRILGLDYDMLKGLADVFSPMVYHGRMGREPEWVRQNIEWFSGKMEIKPGSYPKIWTIVQAYDEPRKISAGEFEKVLRYGAAGSSSGVMMFTTNAVAESPEKTLTMKKVYSEWKNK